MRDTTEATPSETSGAAIPDPRGLNLWRADATFERLLPLYADGATVERLLPHLDRLGELAGSALDDLAMTADQNPPALQHRNRRGEDDERIAYHPAYREMEALAFGEFALASMSHRSGALNADAPLPPVAKYALTYLFAQAEFGLLCPVNMTDSLARTLKRFGSEDLIETYFPRLGHPDPEMRFQGAMFMTEQGAGSDIAATAVRAEPQQDGTYRLTGEKWFCSNADADVALVLARRDGGPDGLKGVGLFLLPRVLPDGRRNAYRIVRLKDKLGTRSMASGEIRLEGATAWLIGDPEAGFKQMADMVNSSRLSNGVRSAGMMRRAFTNALHFARNRTAFGKRVIDMPLMQRQLVKMLMVSEQARTMVLQASEALQCSDAGDGMAARRLRILTPLIKFRACRDARKVTGDAMEVRGGCGYIEEWPEPRLVRDSHLGSIWEGTSNIVALDVIRAVKRENGLEAWTTWVHERNKIARVDGVADLVERVHALVSAAKDDDSQARAAASALYHVGSAVAMAWEGRQTGDVGRVRLAELVLEHRVLPRDPLAPAGDADDLKALLDAA